MRTRTDHAAVIQAPDAFHAHLDVCAQCERHPFNLCSTGKQLIEEAMVKLAAPFAPTPKDRSA